MLPFFQSHTMQEIKRLALPSILINITLPLLSLVDIAIAGHLSDPSLLASLALGTQFHGIILGCCHFLRMSTSAKTAQASGANNPSEISLSLQMGCTWALVLGCLFLLLQPFFLFLSLHLSNPQTDIVEPLSLYLSIRLFDIPAQLFILVCSGWLLGKGQPAKILIITLIAGIINATSSLFLVFVFSWGIEGIAWGTFIASYFGALIALAFVAPALKFQLQHHIKLTFKPSRLFSIFRMNTHLFVRSLLLQSSFTLFFVKSGEIQTEILATNTVLMTFVLLTTYGLDGFADAGEVCMGRAKGAQSKKQGLQVIKAVFAWAFLMTAAYSCFFFFGGELIISLQTNLTSIQNHAQEYLLLMTFFPLFIVGFNTLDGLFLGAGLTILIRNSMILCFAAFAFMIYLLPQTYGAQGIWASLVIFFLLRTTILSLLVPRLLLSLSPEIPSQPPNQHQPPHP
jgi:MATE family multidrug resistance protein